MDRKGIWILIILLVICVALVVRRSIPYSDREDLFSAEISIDSIWTFGPAAGIYDRRSGKYYWLKSYTSLDQTKLDSLKNRPANIRYMKFLQGPLENRIFYMEVDSVVVFDQVIERE
jgi:hypothetical protein